VTGLVHSFLHLLIYITQVQGVTLYVSNFQRPLTERLSKDFFSDPSYASVACAKTGPVAVADNIARGRGGEVRFPQG
jgi:catabolite regulation protein CreA